MRIARVARFLTGAASFAGTFETKSTAFVTLREMQVSGNSDQALPINSGIGLPWLTIGVGRPLKSCRKISEELIPR